MDQIVNLAMFTMDRTVTQSSSGLITEPRVPEMIPVLGSQLAGRESKTRR